MALLASMVTVGVARAESPAPAGIGATLSGYPAAPFAERLLSVTDAGIVISFAAPATAGLAAVHTYWRHAGDCAVTVHDDAFGAPG